ncbi:aminodeoxychorismate/anthranilate synthase component II [Nocardioidaceae bacterium]|nr:aminodeoxychorismate/anthranilate synthase component II [Nocardioidaceae bacterium]
MPEVFLVDHHDSYTFNLAHLIASVTGTLPTVVQHDEVALEDLGPASHLVLSPGPGDPTVATDFALGPGVFALGVPVLGVCLGMQALVVAFGGEVGRVRPAHGEVAALCHAGEPAGVLREVPEGSRVVRYHSLAAVRVPEELVVTAYAEDGPDRTVMAVRHRELPLHGVQFHPESILTEHGATLVASFLAEP